MVSAPCALGASHTPVLQRSSDAGDVTGHETIHRTFNVGNAADVTVDNVWGSIAVVGDSPGQVQLTAEKVIRAESSSDLEQARREVALDVSQNGNAVRFYVDGPFRCNCDSDCHGVHRDRSYTVTLDFSLHVPPNTRLLLKTINDGEISVRGTSGDYRVENVNGGVQMSDIAGSGHVYALNGGVEVRFRENPRAASYFGSLNGNVELYFARGLSADFHFKTFNGQIYSDFPMTSLAPEQPVVERHNGMRVYRADKFTGARVGSGGPKITVDEFNGDIRILQRS